MNIILNRLFLDKYVFYIGKKFMRRKLDVCNLYVSYHNLRNSSGICQSLWSTPFNRPESLLTGALFFSFWFLHLYVYYYQITELIHFKLFIWTRKIHFSFLIRIIYIYSVVLKISIIEYDLNKTQKVQKGVCMYIYTSS